MCRRNTAAACAMGAIRVGRGVSHLGGVKPFGKGKGSSGSSTGLNHCNL